MKYFFYGLLFLTCTYTPVFAQEGLTLKEEDSLYDVVYNAFELNDKSQYGESINVVENLLKLLKVKKNNYLVAEAYNSLSYSYAELKNKEKAFYYAFKSKDLYLKLQDTTSIIIGYNNIGVTYRDFEMLEESNKAFTEAKEYAKDYKEKYAMAYPNYNLGYNLMEYSKDYPKALQYLKTALKCLNKSNNKSQKRIHGDIWLCLGVVYYKMKDYKSSKIYFNKAIELCKEKGYLKLLEAIYEYKIGFLKEEKKHEEVTKMYEKYVEVKDSIYKIENIALARNIEAKFKVKESEEKLSFIEKEKLIQEQSLEKSNRFNILLGVLSGLLFITLYWGYKKNRALKEARDKAEKLSKVKSDFYSEISHELRTPLYAVIELSGLLLKENVSAKHKEYLESLKFSGNHLMSLINNVLQINKAESGKMKIQLLDFQLKNLVYNIIDSLEYALRNSNNRIHLDYDDTIPITLVGDSLKLSQVFINLISNAIKFTQNGDININIKKEKETEDTINIDFSIADTGQGIAKEKQIKIFEDYYQDETKTENVYNGTGLGLSIVKRILTVMDSSIDIESEVGKGTTLSFNIAFKKSDKSNELTALYTNQLERIGKKYILVVDDNKINQLVTKKVLESLEIESKVVDSGERAIEAVKKEKFDCILMDLHMPQLDGYETTKLIREFNTEIPIIALTAATTDEVEMKIKKYDINDYILKPFVTTEFVEVLNKVIHS